LLLRHATTATMAIETGQTNRAQCHIALRWLLQIKFPHLVNPASSDRRTMDKILEEEIQFLN